MGGPTACPIAKRATFDDTRLRRAAIVRPKARCSPIDSRQIRIEPSIINKLIRAHARVRFASLLSFKRFCNGEKATRLRRDAFTLDWSARLTAARSGERGPPLASAIALRNIEAVSEACFEISDTSCSWAGSLAASRNAATPDCIPRR